ncbi:DgyrCDS1392 [Dimorphilus gyrociliatus]|uniref:DgyrCDS1392 n=1 Tax=Dimorphilus gyrociliatus TaxID=2664684 RepID=A0A7I8V8N9_9ANNE|nr:DgyrCDS1392 [Dimorphilus gyrociliatus]
MPTPENSLTFEEENENQGLETPTEECVLSCHPLSAPINEQGKDIKKHVATDIRTGTVSLSFSDLKVTSLEKTGFTDICNLNWIDLQKKDKPGTMILLSNPSNPLVPENGHYNENVSFEKTQFIAEGAFARVLLAKDKKSKKKFVLKEYKVTETYLDMVLTEIKVLSILGSYDNFLSFYAFCYFSSTVAVFMEQFEGQTFCVDLRSFVHDYNPTTYELRTIFKDITECLCIMHSKGIQHEDIKLENILVANVKGKLQAKLIDFNCSRFQDDICKFRGNLLSWSPEKITRSSYDYKNDIWSLGISYLTAKTKSIYIYLHVEEYTEPLQFLYQLGRLSKIVGNNEMHEDLIKMRLGEHEQLQLMKYSSSLADMKNYELDFILATLSIDPLRRLSSCELLKLAIFKDLSQTLQELPMEN